MSLMAKKRAARQTGEKITKMQTVKA